MSTRNITVRPSHSDNYSARWRAVDKQLTAHGAKIFGSLARCEERAERFQVAAAKKEARKNSSLERLADARRQEQAAVAERMRTRAAEMAKEEEHDDEQEMEDLLQDTINFATSGMEAEEYLQWKVNEAWMAYTCAETPEGRVRAFQEVREEMNGLANYYDGNPLHVLAATAEMLTACGNDSDSEDSDYIEETA